MGQFQQKDLLSLIVEGSTTMEQQKQQQQQKREEQQKQGEQKRKEQEQANSMLKQNEKMAKQNEQNTAELLQSPSIEDLEKEIKRCNFCQLRPGATQVVVSDGNPHSRLMLVGEAPGADEDREGVPFIGRAGQLLTKILNAVDLQRDDVYITNIVKCRPPGNRTPSSEEIKHCIAYLEKQIEAINPGIIICLGSPATRTLIDKHAYITKVRGKWVQKDGRLYMPTFHPAALLRDVQKKRPTWEDFQLIASKYRELL